MAECGSLVSYGFIYLYIFSNGNSNTVSSFLQFNR